MISKWYELKNEAIKLRKKGFSIRKIEDRLGIPRSTLSGWLRDIQLSLKQKEKLLKDWRDALAKARKKAVLWHNEQKRKRLREAEKDALNTLKNINLNNQDVLELTLAILYLGEGSKKEEVTALGNSNPLILKFFLAILRGVYNIDIKKIRCELHLRADQDPKKMKLFWARELKLPLKNFRHVNIDKRTVGTKTYPHYKGVCCIKCGSVSIQRKLICLSKLFCEQVSKNNLGAWRSG